MYSFEHYGVKNLYKVLIVDDFESDRLTLRKIIESWQDNSFKIVGECESGLQAMQFLEEITPDIIISDIEMPFLNGVDMAKIIKEKYNSIKIIFCTLYNEFKYAKEAIYANSYGYILKPIQSEELYECLENVAGEITNEVKSMNEVNSIKKTIETFKPILADNFLIETLYGINIHQEEFAEKVEYFNLNINNGYYRVVYLEIDDFEIVTSNFTTEEKQLLSIRVLGKIKNFEGEEGGFPVTRVGEMQYAVILSGTEIQHAEEETYEHLNKIQKYLQKINISVTIAVSNISNTHVELKNLFEQCKYIMRYKYTIGKGKVISSTDIPNKTEFISLDINSLQKDIRYLLDSGSREEISRYFDSEIGHLSERLDETTLRNYCFQILICVKIALSENNVSLSDVFTDESLLWDKLQKFETILDQGNWLKNILLFANDYLSQKSTSKNKIIVDKIIEFISQNINKNYGLIELASEMHYSPNYLNCIFKQEMGMTINDFITSEKVAKAKEMLKDVRNRVQSVSDELGYSHAAYFCSVFKKSTGMTPKEYREKIHI